MIVLALIFLAIVAFVIAAVAGVILNIVRAARGKARPLPKRAYWDPSHPRYRAEPPAQG